jgi:hypothetical protein
VDPQPGDAGPQGHNLLVIPNRHFPDSYVHRHFNWDGFPCRIYSGNL